MENTTLIERAIESAKCRIYRVRANVGKSLEHQIKADNQAEIQQVTIDALEKQVPKKPIELDKWGEYYECPICNKYAVDNLGCKYKFCRECGQKFDWQTEI